MVHVAADLAQFVQRRELMAYQQRLARMAYAYGVDLRRSAWLDHSTFGEPLMRGVDRRWNRLVQGLMEDSLERPDRAIPTDMMEEIARILKLLRGPLPTLRRLRPDVAASWPMVTALGTTKGGAYWLVLDVDRLQRLSDHERTFLLGAGVGNLQCDHGPIVAAHLMAHRAGRGLGLVRRLLRPWSKVAVFSADRAGLLALGELEPAVAALRAHGEASVDWMPSAPSLDLREKALRDFDRSRVMTRLRHSTAKSESWSVAPAREDEADAEAARAAAEGSAAPTGEAPTGDEKAEASGPPPPPSDEPDQALEAALAESWTLARCDALLTRRLGLF